MTRSKYRGNLLLPLILVAGGVLLLLSNLGIVGFDAWDTVLRLWPILLIAVGLDLVVGGSSFRRGVSAVVTVCVLLAVGFAAFHLFAPDRWVAREQAVSVPLDGATAARITLLCADCDVRVDGRAPADALIEGHVSVRRSKSLAQSSTLAGGTIAYELTSQPILRLPFVASLGRGAAWRLSLNSGIPIDLVVSSQGSVDLDLQELRITALDVTSGDGPSSIVLAEAISARYSVFGDDLTLIVPEGMGVRIDRATSVAISAPSDYVQTAREILSPTYETADSRATVVLRPGTGNVSIVVLADRNPDSSLND